MASIYVTANSLRLDVAGFCQAVNIDPLLHGFGPLRGEDFTADGVDGDTYRAKAQGSLIAPCSFLVFGFKDESGVAHPDRWSGLRDNLDTIRSTVVGGTKSATKTLTLTYPDAGTTTASYWCRTMDVFDQSGDLTGVAKRVVLEFRIPSGALS